MSAGIRNRNSFKSSIHHSWLSVCVAIFILAGCQRTYYALWEKMGKEKRHLLKENLQKSRQEQVDATEQVASVVERIKAMYGFDGKELEAVYQDLNADYQDCVVRAENVRERIDKVERIAADLFSEWEAELANMESARLKSKSRSSLNDTRQRFARLQRSMAHAEASTDPVLANLRDYVLYLKHNLNAQAVSSLKREVTGIESEVASLIADMNLPLKRPTVS